MTFNCKNLFLGLCALATALGAQAQEKPNRQKYNEHKFSQLNMELPTPNTYRTASGAPGHQYWQQRADYNIKVELNDDKQSVSGEETITYYNNSPDVLTYLWLQMDQNLWSKDSETKSTATASISERMSFSDLNRMLLEFDGGFKIDFVKDATDKPLKYTVVHTMMRVDLPQPLKPGATYTFKTKWSYNINDGANYGGRCGYELFPKDGNYTYHIAQFYPRMCSYNDVHGWQHKQYLGTGEFALSFGNYSVSITVPDDHIVACTGELQNANDVLTSEQKSRFEKAKTSPTPVVIVTQAEAEENEKEKGKGKKTWTFKADNVRDVAFATSRKFIWDAMGVKFGDRTVMAMSYYPKEGNPLWGQYSTQAVVQTLRTYSKFTFDYPYPVAISTHASFTGMEYPMICFNFGRPEADGTYSERTKNAMLGVIIHEVGHNYFPMIVNSDERQWMWMDEGLNSFLEYLTEQEWDRDFPSRRGPAYALVDYMKGDPAGLTPIMGSSDYAQQLGNSNYGKPATALNILRETVLGRELFDFAFKEYANRWKFKHPEPADLFRTMEDASGVDLDWFWRGWFFTTEPVDISLDNMKWFRIDTKNPEVEKPWAKKMEDEKPEFISDTRNKKDIPQTAVERDPNLRDFYSTYDKYKVDALDKQEYEKFITGLDDSQKKMINLGYNFYQLDFSNKGGLISPIILEFTFTDGTKEVQRIPAEIWRMNTEKCSKVFYFQKEVSVVTVDPFLETTDIDTQNNRFPRELEPSRFQLFKQQGYGRYGGEGENPMQRDKKIKQQESGGK